MRSAPPEEFRWQPGQSGNPSGDVRARARGLAKYVRTSTLQGKELADFMLKVARGEDWRPEYMRYRTSKKGRRQLNRRPTARLRDMMIAVDWLANRGYGKPAQTLELTQPGGIDTPEETRSIIREELRKLPTEVVQALREAVARAKAAQPALPAPTEEQQRAP